MALREGGLNKRPKLKLTWKSIGDNWESSLGGITAALSTGNQWLWFFTSYVNNLTESQEISCGLQF